ncbi:hypothetical protein I3843_01G248100 [Carya illinoinensis]|nr:hypothetical protein I3760_01G252900 [Carya illinoinensis]KAG7998227.1 hypothetical protein I3843_01G248100 [Carya illinoinensis]
MKSRAFACLVLIMCTHQILSSSALRNSLDLENEGSQKLSKRLREEQEVVLHVNGTVGLYNGKQEIYDSGKSQRGKGAYGGANIVHRPHPENKNAASLLATPTPPFFISIFVATVGFVFIFVSPFRLL